MHSLFVSHSKSDGRLFVLLSLRRCMAEFRCFNRAHLLFPTYVTATPGTDCVNSQDRLRHSKN